jgi:predicted RecB family nuclease
VPIDPAAIPELPKLRFAPGAQRARLTGSHVYGHLACEHLVSLDLFGDPEQRAAMRPGLEDLLARGRKFEDGIQAELGYDEPEYPRADFAAGAAATLELLEAGVPGVAQGVLFEDAWLGIPDLLRREPGASRLGDFHYVVGDVKSSWRSRSDQAMQVAFYTRLLARLQGRMPDYGYLILRSGEEQRVDVHGLDPVLESILQELVAQAAGELETRPHRGLSCASCRWRELCVQGAEVDWLPGITRSTRELLRRAGLETIDALLGEDAPARVREIGLAHASFLRARNAARATREGRAVRTRKPREFGDLSALHAVWVGRDGFDDRCVVFGVRSEGEAPTICVALRDDVEDECFGELLGKLSDVPGRILHGPEWPAVLARFAARRPELLPRIQRVEARGVPAVSAVQGSHAFPEPVRMASEIAAWLRGRAPDEELREQHELLAALARVEDAQSLRSLADAELAALLELGVHLRSELTGAGAGGRA